MSLRSRARLAVATLIAVVMAMAFPTSVQAGGGSPGHRHHHGDDTVTVMTQNLYLGSSLTPALEATTPAAFVAAVAQIYGTAVFTNFPRRAEAIADTIAAQDPDLVGLQEVTNWVARPLVAGAAPPSFDFLTILQAALAKRGLHYQVAVVSQNADIGPAPLVAPGFGCGAPTSPTTPQCVVTLQDRDVILVNGDTRGLKVEGTATGDDVAQQQFQPPGAATPVSFARGWASVDASYRGTDFRFLTTHLEVEDFAAVQEAQAAEFLAGPAKAPGRVIATGDFNSAADPATTSTPTTTYADLTSSWFKDAWDVNDGDPGLSCCQNSPLTNLVSGLRTRIDLVLTHGSVKARSADLVGDQPIASVPPLWASDHAGVVAELSLHGWKRGH
jgi:endonuclease/exonuclease/phosphatase family metal-dependent hydrolase